MKKLIALLLALVMMLALVACGGSTETQAPAEAPADAPAEEAAAADEPRVLRVGTTDAGGGFDPWSGTSGPQNYLGFETIMMRTGTGEYEPWLAESVEWVDDTTMRIQMNPNAKFANGEPVLGEDVVYTFFKSATAASVMAVHFANIDFEATTVSEDGLTVDFKLKQPYGPLMAYLDIPYVVDKSQCEDWAATDERWWDAPPTSSAYEIVENISGSHTTFALREDYWNTERMPDWDEVVINYYSDPTAMFIAYENGELDVVLGVANNDLDRIKAGEVRNMETVSYELLPSKAAHLLCLSSECEPLQDIKVREAIAHVVDGEAAGIATYGDYFELCDSVICEGTKYYKPVGTYELDLDYALQCMAESGYPDGFEMNVASMVSDEKLWQVIQNNLAQLGITVNFQTYDMATCIGMWMTPGANDAMLITCAGGNVTGDPYADLSANWKNGMLQAAKVMDEEYNAIFEQFVYNTDEAVREEYCHQVQQWLYDNFHCIPLCQPYYGYAYRSDVVASCDFFSGQRANVLYCEAK